MKTASVFVLMCLVNLFAPIAQAQPPQLLWMQTYDDGALEHGAAVRPMADSGYVVAGMTESGPDGTFDLWIIRADEQGSLTSSRYYTWDDYSFEAAFDMLLMADGGLIVYADEYVDGQDGAALFGLDAQGDTLWERFYVPPVETWRPDIPRDHLYATLDGGFLFTRRHATVEQGFGMHTWLVKVNAEGDTLWTREIGEGLDFTPLQIYEHEDGGFTIVAEKYAFSPNQTSICTVELGMNGDSLTSSCNDVWGGDFGGGHSLDIGTADRLPDGGYLLTGSVMSTSDSLWAARTDAQLNVLWSRVYGWHVGWNSFGAGTCSMLLPDESLVIGDGWGTQGCMRISGDGDSLWQRTGIPSIKEIFPTSDGGFVAVGFSDGDVMLARVAPVLSTPQHTPAVPAEIEMSVFPNPFNPVTQIAFTLPKAQHAAINVFDVTGRNVAILADANFSAGEHRLAFDGSPLPSGVYFAELRTVGTTERQKLLLLK